MRGAVAAGTGGMMQGFFPEVDLRQSVTNVTNMFLGNAIVQGVMKQNGTGPG